jgi:flagellar basal-body rod modification protein FlgD
MATTGGIGDVPAGTSIFSARTKEHATSKGDDLGKDDFMKLMLAQLQHQDPLKPMDDQAFIAQTAQFNALDQMTKLNKTLEAVLDAQQLTEASGMIGKFIAATEADGKVVTGAVTAASVNGGVAMIHMGNIKIELDKVTAVASNEEALPEGTPATEGAEPDA